MKSGETLWTDLAGQLAVLGRVLGRELAEVWHYIDWPGQAIVWCVVFCAGGFLSLRLAYRVMFAGYTHRMTGLYRFSWAGMYDALRDADVASQSDQDAELVESVGEIVFRRVWGW